MPDKRGGYQKPKKPAAASGPGALSKRTDGGPQAPRDLPNAGYGENKEFETAQAGAPMAGRMPMPSGGPGPSAAGPPAGSSPVDVVPMGAPSQNPDEPITAGAPVGEGVGMEAMGLIPQDQRLQQQDQERLRLYLPYLEWMANQPSASASTRALVRQVKAQLM